VIDVLNGVVVHAVRGNRQTYKPLQSVITPSIDVVEVALAFKMQGFSTLYLADLDAILGKKPVYTFYDDIAKLGFSLLVDAGVTDVQMEKKLLRHGVSKVVVGTETLQSKRLLTEIIKQVGADKISVSFDVKGDKVLTHPSFDGPTDLFELYETFRVVGVSEFILLDLNRVGSDEGVNAELLQKVLPLLAGSVYVGGGVRCVDDLLRFKELNVLGVLFATALHLGKITVNDLKRVDLF
jgi:phosphoribosylformimino-5-aminoimidazole carboxamide ribotide isomerase